MGAKAKSTKAKKHAAPQSGNKEEEESNEKINRKARDA